MDNRSGAADLVAAGVCEQLHDGRVHPYSAGDRDRCGVGQGHPGTKSLVKHGHPAVHAGDGEVQPMRIKQALFLFLLLPVVAVSWSLNRESRRSW